jgi:hypothetical protein
LIADKLKKTQEEIDDMDADEFHTWIAYYNLQDPEYKQGLEAKIRHEDGTTLDAILDTYNKAIKEHGKQGK